jgi:DUF4097 and DUF4098 domain-containing protein YvlB
LEGSNVKEEVKRILHLVEQGRLKPEEAAELIDALSDVRSYTESAPGPKEPSEEAKRMEESDSVHTEHAGEKEEDAAEESGEGGFFGRIGRIAEDALKGIKWQEIGETIRTHTQRGMSEMRKALDELEREGWKIGRLGKHEARAEYQLTFSVEAGQTVQIEVPNGDIQITGGFDGGRVDADITLRGRDDEMVQSRIQGWALMVQQTENGVAIRAPESDQEMNEQIDLNIQVPTGVHVQVATFRGDVQIIKNGANVQVSTMRGDVHIENARDTLSVQTAQGDVQVNDFEGETVEVDTKNGDIDLSAIRANAIITRTASGDIILHQTACRDITAETVKGDVELELLEPLSGKVQVSTVSGDIVMTLPDGGDCHVTIENVAGDIECSLPCREVAKESHRWTGICGDGTGELKASTIHGDIDIHIKPVETC